MSNSSSSDFLSLEKLSVDLTINCWKQCFYSLYSAPLTLDTELLRLSVKQGGIKYHFWVFGMTRSGSVPRFPRPLAKLYPQYQWTGIDQVCQSFFSLTIFLSLCLSVRLSLSLSIYIYMYIYITACTYLSIYLSIYLS